MMATRKFITQHKPEGHLLTLGHSNHFIESQVGSIWYENGKVHCQEQNLEVDGKVYYNKIESSIDERGLPCSA